MKTTLIKNTLTVTGFILCAGIPYSLLSQSFLSFVIGCAGFALMMTGLLKGVK